MRHEAATSNNGERAQNVRRRLRRVFRRGPWENAMMVAIALGVVMLTQPLSLVLYGHSFTVILIGTVGYVAASHLPE